MTELEKLKAMLDQANIPYETNDDVIIKNPKYKICRVVYPSLQNTVCSAIQGYGTYGWQANLIEIQGLAQYEESNEILGWLSAEDVFDRIQNHWKSKGNYIEPYKDKLTFETEGKEYER